MLKFYLGLCVCAALSAPTVAFDTVINIPPAMSVGDIQSSTQINFLDGADFGRLDVPSGPTDVQINVIGGELQTIRAVFSRDVNVSGGDSGLIWVGAVNMTGGDVERLQFNRNSVIQGGRVGELSYTDFPTVDIRGGVIEVLRPSSGSTTTMSGGRFGELFLPESSPQADPIPQTIRLRGGEFRIDGQPVSGSRLTQSDEVITGVLEDGSSFVFGPGDRIRNGGFRFIQTPIPSAPLLIDLATDEVPNGLRPGQTVIAHAGDDLGTAFHSNRGTIRLEGGSLGSFAKLLGGQLTIDGGTVAGRRDAGSSSGTLNLVDGTDVTFNSGSIEGFEATNIGVFRMLGGTLGDPRGLTPRVMNGGRFELHGGEIFQSIRLDRDRENGSESHYFQSGGLAEQVNISFGTFDLIGGFINEAVIGSSTAATIRGGHVRRLSNPGMPAIVTGGRIGQLTGSATLHGRFEVNGVTASGVVSLDEEDILTGVLSDGTPIVLAGRLGDEIATAGLTLVDAEPPIAAPGPFVAPFDSITAGLRAGQTLTLASGADTGKDFVSLGGTLNVAGGVLGDDSVVAGGVMTISSGTVGRRFTAIKGAQILLAGGTDGVQFSDGPSVLDGSDLTMIGGAVEGVLTIDGTSRLGAFGGQVDHVTLEPGSTARLGGTFIAESVRVSTARLPDAPRSHLEIDGGAPGRMTLDRADATVTAGEFISFSVADESTAQIHGGTFTELGAFTGSVAEFEAGEVTRSLTASGGGVVNVRGGSIAELRSDTGGEINVIGAESVVNYISARGGVTNLSGARVRNNRVEGGVSSNFVSPGATVNLQGGTVFGGFSLSGALVVSGGGFGRGNVIANGGELTLVGGEFRLNGEPVSGELSPSDNYVLTGVLADGSVVILSAVTEDDFRGGVLKLMDAPIPAVSAVVNVPNDAAPLGLRSGQTLNLGDGGAIGDHFGSVEATINMTGGTVGYGAELRDTVANVSGGEVGPELFVHDRSTLNLNGGEIGPEATFEAGSSLVMTGGATSPETVVRGDATISGGNPARGLETEQGAIVELVGAGFETFAVETSRFLPLSVTAGVLQDGTPVLLGIGDRAELTLTEVSVPDAPSAVINAPVDPTPRGVRPGQTVNLGTGAETVPDFTAIGGHLTVDGGVIGPRMEALRTEIVVREGSIGEAALLYDQTSLTVLDGDIGDGLSLTEGATAGVLGGTVGLVTLYQGGTINLAGGDFNGQPADLFGGDFWSEEGSEFNLFGLSFTQGGVELLDGLDFGDSVVITDKAADVAGVLSEGSSVSLVTGGRARIIGRADFTVTKLLLGDFNHDGLVDSADYTIWRDTLGEEVESGTGADHDFDGRITDRDREVWASRFGATADSVLTNVGTAVPEPATLLLAGLLGGFSCCRRKR